MKINYIKIPKNTTQSIWYRHRQPTSHSNTKRKSKAKGKRRKPSSCPQAQDHSSTISLINNFPQAPSCRLYQKSSPSVGLNRTLKKPTCPPFKWRQNTHIYKIVSTALRRHKWVSWLCLKPTTSPAFHNCGAMVPQDNDVVPPGFHLSSHNIAVAHCPHPF